MKPDSPNPRDVLSHFALRSARTMFPIALCIVLAILLAGSLIGILRLQKRAQAYMPGSLPPLNPLMTVPQRGVNVQLDRYPERELQQTLSQVRETGFNWVRQTFLWADIEPRPGDFAWEPWDRIVEATHREGLQLIAVLDTAPAWALPAQTGGIHSPPQETADFGHFVRAFATRYGKQVDYYQIWDEPNLSYHWGERAVDAEAYASLVREGAIQIRDADPVAWILLAGLAPTVETGPLNVNAPDYLGRIYAAGGADYFDIVAAKCYGFQHDAWDRRLGSDLLNFSRVQLLRQVMERNADSATPIWAVEFGWNHLPSDWIGASPPWKSVTAEEQIEYTLGAFARAEKEWPWMGAMVLATWQPNAPPEDPVWGFALVDREGHHRTLLQVLRQDSEAASPRAYVGRYPPDHPTGHYEGGWQVTPEGADIGSSRDRLTVPFQGTRFDLTVRKGRYWALLYVAIDGEPTPALPQSDDGRSYLVLYSPSAQTENVVLGRYLSDGDHTVEIEAQGGWGEWVVQGWSVHRETDTRLYMAVRTILALGLLVTLSVGAILVRPLPWPRWTAVVLDVYSALPSTAPYALTLLCAAGVYVAPSLPLSLLALALLALFLFLAPSTGLPVVALAMPFYRQPKELGDMNVGMSEIVILIAFAAWVVRELLLRSAAHSIRDRSLSHLSVGSPTCWPLTPLDWGMVSLGLVSLLSISVVHGDRVALREFRTVIVEPLLFYLMLRATLSESQTLWRVADGWIAGGLIVAVWGLLQFASGQGVITTGEVWRVRGPYGSPNNLALMLGRQIPLLVSVAAFAATRWRRLIYGFILVPLVVAFYLSYSRGGWLAGLPLPLMFLGLVRGGRAAWSVVGALVLGSLGAIPILRTERFSSLLNTHQGTLFFRLKLWQSSLAMGLDHPVAGVGLDNFLYQYRSRYVLPSAWQEPNLSHPHNLLLEFWTRLGVLGVGALLWIQLQFFRQAWRLYRRLPEGDSRALALGAMGGMVNVLSHGLVDNGFFVIDLAYAFCLLVGFAAQLAQQGHGRNGELTACQDMLQ